MTDNNGFTTEEKEQIREIIQQETSTDSSTSVSRRGLLGGLGAAAVGLGGGAYGGTQRARAQEGSGSIGTEDNPLDEIYVDELHNYTQTDDITADSISAEEANNTIYASNNLDDYPSIQEAVDRLDPDNNVTAITVIGGENEISNTIDLSGLTDGGMAIVSDIPDENPLVFETVGSTIKQADGADLQRMIDLGGSYIHLDVDLDGNRDNQAVDVTGVYGFQQRNPSEFYVRGREADTLLELQDHTERTETRVFATRCGTAFYLWYDPDDPDVWSTPDNNDAIVRAHDCDLVADIYNEEGVQGFTAHLTVLAEACDSGVRFRGTSLWLGGHMRTCRETGLDIECQSADIALSKLHASDTRGTAAVINNANNVTFHGGFIEGWDEGVIIGESESCDSVRFVGTRFNRLYEFSIRRMDCDNLDLITPQLYEGRNTGMIIDDQQGDLTGRDDVDAINVPAANIGEITTEPNGALVTKTGGQSFPRDTATRVEWQDAIWDSHDCFDASENTIVVPSGISYARLGVNLRIAEDDITDVFVLFRINGDSFPGSGEIRKDVSAGDEIRFGSERSAWVPVEEGDELSIDVYNDNDDGINVPSSNATWFEVEMV